MTNPQTTPDEEGVLYGCGYQGYEFGASYPDSICIEGQLWDADACGGDGMMCEPMNYIPCPMCHPIEYIKCARESYDEYYWYELGWWKTWLYAICLWLDIKKNRIFGTEPWKRKKK